MGAAQEMVGSMVTRKKGVGAARGALPVITHTASAGSNANSTSYTFSSLGSGSGDDRYLIIAVGGRSSLFSRSVNSVTVSGSPATIVIAPSAVYFTALAIFDLSGQTSVDVVVGTTGEVTNLTCGLWAVSTLRFDAAVDTDTATGTNPSVTLNSAVNGVCFAVISQDGSNTTDFGDLSVDYSLSQDSSTFIAGGSAITSSATVTAVSNYSGSASRMVAATWR